MSSNDNKRKVESSTVESGVKKAKTIVSEVESGRVTPPPKMDNAMDATPEKIRKHMGTHTHDDDGTADKIHIAEQEDHPVWKKDDDERTKAKEGGVMHWLGLAGGRKRRRKKSRRKRKKLKKRKSRRKRGGTMSKRCFFLREGAENHAVDTDGCGEIPEEWFGCGSFDGKCRKLRGIATNMNQFQAMAGQEQNDGGFNWFHHIYNNFLNTTGKKKKNNVQRLFKFLIGAKNKQGFKAIYPPNGDAKFYGWWTKEHTGILKDLITLYKDDEKLGPLVSQFDFNKAGTWENFIENATYRNKYQTAHPDTAITHDTMEQQGVVLKGGRRRKSRRKKRRKSKRKKSRRRRKKSRRRRK